MDHCSPVLILFNRFQLTDEKLPASSVVSLTVSATFVPHFFLYLNFVCNIRSEESLQKELPKSTGISLQKKTVIICRVVDPDSLLIV